LGVWMNGIRVATWSATRSAAPQLDYDPDWVAHPDGRPLSLSLPFAFGNPPLRGDHVAAWFDNLLPDSTPIRTRLAARFGVPARDAHALLAEIGRDCVGAVQLLPVTAPPPVLRPPTGTPLTAPEVAAHLRAAVGAGRSGGAPAPDGAFRISIAGAQEKAALLWLDGRWCIPNGATPTTHIFKLPMGVLPRGLDLRTSVENEWVCGRLLSAMGLRVARSTMATFEDEHGPITTLIVDRFDRRLQPGADGALLRLPQEDLCQALGLPSTKKYESDGRGDDAVTTERVLRLLGNSRTAPADQEQFALAQLAFWLLGATDGHAKNFSLFLEAGATFCSTPLYDVLSAWPLEGVGPNRLHHSDLQLAIGVRGRRRIRRPLDKIHRAHWQQLATTLQGVTTVARMEALVERVPAAIATVEAELPPTYPGDVWDAITGGLRRQRARFLAGRE
jgi:serine/threonine-protein kinase HipA